MYSRVYASAYRIYADDEFSGEKPQLVVIEDSNSGFEFFSALCSASGIRCVSAYGKTNIYDVVRDAAESDILVIADGAAFGPEMAYLASLRRFKSIKLFLPESFEWLVLRSGLFPDMEVQKMLLNPAEYIECSDFFSWEQFFTAELVERSKDSYLAYSKSKLNAAYLDEKAAQAIKGTLPELGI